jgi:leucyl/phenylalanyl-tRNA--protein transferase
MGRTINPLHFIGQEDWEVPDPNSSANSEGLIALSWELAPELYDRCYHKGIFPWFEQEGVVFWFSPEVRSITPTAEVKVAKSMRPYLNKKQWRFSVNTVFEKVIEKCSEVPRPGQAGTWISEKFQINFLHMHQLGMAHSFEVWEGDELIGGTFGVMTGGIFVGESMFHTRTNASKFAYIGMCQHLNKNGVEFVDNQLPTEHLDSLGAWNIDRNEFLELMDVHSESRERVVLEALSKTTLPL